MFHLYLEPPWLEQQQMQTDICVVLPFKSHEQQHYLRFSEVVNTHINDPISFLHIHSSCMWKISAY